jgi:hypothetical protein
MPSRERQGRSPSSSPQPGHNPRSDALAESLGRLEQAVAEIQDSETFRRYLDAQARFHRYVRPVLPKRALLGDGRLGGAA